MTALDLPTAARRTTKLARINWTVLSRNRMTLIYAVVMPLLPLGILLLNDPSESAGAQMISTTVLMGLIFPGYYNLLSLFVSRRDELVLKRLRTGEVRDGELLASMALPGVVITMAVLVLAVPVAMVAGLRFPFNPLLLIVGVLVALVAFAAFAIWTAAWTRTAESAQLTSGPVIVLAMVGLVWSAFPASWQDYAFATPGGAITELLGAAWFARGDGGATLSWLQTWQESLPALGSLAAWAVLALALAMRALRWEPRT